MHWSRTCKLCLLALAAFGCNDKPVALPATAAPRDAASAASASPAAVTAPHDAASVASAVPAPAPVPSLEQDSPATAACKPVFVRLYSTSWNARDKPAISHQSLWNTVQGDADLTGPDVQYLIENDGGTPWVGAKVPSVVVGDKLVAAYKAKHPAARPMVFCREPMNVKRQLTVGDSGLGRFVSDDLRR